MSIDIAKTVKSLKQWSHSNSLVVDTKEACYKAIHQLDWNNPFFEHLTHQQRQDALSTLKIALQRQSLELLDDSNQIVVSLDVCFWGQDENAIVSRDAECQFIAMYNFNKATVTHELLWGRDNETLFENCCPTPPTNITTFNESLVVLEKWLKTHNPVPKAKALSLSALEKWDDTTTCPASSRKKLFGRYYIDELRFELIEVSLTYEHGMANFPYIAVLFNAYAPNEDQDYLGTTFYLANTDGSIHDFYCDFEEIDEAI